MAHSAVTAHGQRFNWKDLGGNHPRKNEKRQMSCFELARMIDQARRMVVFTGAGISTESGIPDFRSPGGIWTRIKPIYFDEFISDPEKRRESWTQFFSGTIDLTGRFPNAGHDAVARLVKSGKAFMVITQNVDNLHQASGVPPEKIIELHGNVSYGGLPRLRRTPRTCRSKREFPEGRRSPLLPPLRRPREGSGHIVRAAHACGCHAACRRGHPELRSVSGAGVVPRGLSGRRVSDAGQASRGGARHRQSRANRTGSIRGSGVERRDRNGHVRSRAGLGNSVAANISTRSGALCQDYRIRHSLNANGRKEQRCGS